MLVPRVYKVLHYPEYHLLDFLLILLLVNFAYMLYLVSILFIVVLSND